METKGHLRAARAAMREAANKARDAARLLDLSADALHDVELNQAIKAEPLARAAAWDAKHHAMNAAVILDEANRAAASVAR